MSIWRRGRGARTTLIALFVLSLLGPTGSWAGAPAPAGAAAGATGGGAAGKPAGPATNTPNPTSVTLVGDLQHTIGCGGDWDPTCAATHLTYDANDDVWQGTWTVPAGTWNYKAALNDSWTENYGLHGEAGGANIPLTLASPTTVKFYYDHKSHWITDKVNSIIATVPGSFQHALGCSGDWDPGCLRSWLEDVPGSGTYSFDTTAIPHGNYEAKVTINEDWSENYGLGGVPNGPNIPFTVPFDGAQVRFRYNPTSHVLTILAGHSHDNNVEYAGLGHNSRDTIYRQPGGAVTPGTPTTLRFRTFHNDVTNVQVRVYDTATSSQSIQDMQMVAAGVSCYDSTLDPDTCDYYEAAVTPTQLGTLYYRFIITDGSATAYYADDNQHDGGWGVATPNLIDNSYDITVYDPSFQAIPWMQNAIVYQIFPDRFRNGRANNDPTGAEPRYSYPSNPLDQIIPKAWSSLPEGYCQGYVNPAQPCTESPRGRDYFGGDLQGIDSRLNYLQALGITTIYLNPIFDSASNHGYDTQNYFQIDPFFGTQQDWTNLQRHAAQRGIRIILDGVFNHVSSDSPYFDRYHHFAAVGACEAVNSPYRDWFTFTAQAGGPCAGPGGANTMTYVSWAGFDSLPQLNKNNQSVRNLIYAQGNNSVAPYWLNQGGAGWRLDVMPDGSFPADFWPQFRTAVKATKSDAPIIGELWHKGDVLPFIQGNRADTTMDYRFRNAVQGFFGKIDNKGFPDDGATNQPPSLFASKLSSEREDYPDATYYTLMHLLDSHDTERILWSLTPGQNNREDKEFNTANVALGKQRLRLADIVQFTMPGAPTIYYGDEVAMTGDTDPDGRRTFPWTGNGPFGVGGDPNQWLSERQLILIRQLDPVFRTGAVTFLLTDDTHRTLAYGLRAGNQVAIVAINRNETGPQTLTIPLAGYLRDGVAFIDGLSGAGATSQAGHLTLTLPALGGAILIARPGQDLTPPAHPTGLTATPGNGQVTLSWPAVPGAAGYRVYRSPLSGGGFTFVAGTTSPGYTNTGLTNATLYYYVVTALDAPGNESGWSNQANAVPYAPIGWAGHLWPPSLTITINALQHQTVYAQVWVDGVTPGPGQGPGVIAEFAYGPQGSDPATWAWQPMVYNTDVGNNDEYKIDFTPEQTGHFDYLARFSTDLRRHWTYAYTDASNRGSLIVNPSSDTTAPAAPGNLHVVTAAPNSITLGWDANGEPDLYRYEVWRSATHGGPYTKIANVPAGTQQYADTGVTTGNTYYYVITAQDTSFNRSPNSSEVAGQAQTRTVHVTFNITVPATTDGTGRTVHIAGSFPAPYPQWDPASLPATRVDATHWTITLDLPEATALEYKYVLGDWNYVEKDGSCQEIGNRQLTVVYGPGGTQTVTDTVANWRNVAPCGN